MTDAADMLDLSQSPLPELPPVSLLLADLLSSDEAEVEQLMQRLSDAPELAEDSLHFINSAVFQPRRTLSDLRRAAVLFGTHNATRLCFTVSVLRHFSALPLGGLDHDSYWLRVLLSAAAARLLAERESGVAADEAIFVASLQTLGMLHIDAKLPEFYHSFGEQWPSRPQQRALETTRCHCEHGQLSGAMLKRWGITGDLAEALVLNAIDAAETPNSKAEKLAFIAGLAALIAELPFCNAPDQLLQQLHHHCQQGLAWQDGQLAMQLHLFRNLLPTLQPQAERLRISSAALMRIDRRARDILQLPRITAASRHAASEPPQKHRDKAVSEVSEAIDPATGLYNRHIFPQLLQTAINRCEFDQQALSLVVIQVDKFSEQQPQSNANALLEVIAQTLERFIRKDDIAARINDATFAIALPDAPHTAAVGICQRLEEQLEKVLEKPGSTAPSVTVSSRHCTADEENSYPNAQQLLAKSGAIAS